MMEFDRSFSVVYLSLCSAQRFENEHRNDLDPKKKLITQGIDEKASHCFGNTDLRKVAHN